MATLVAVSGWLTGASFAQFSYISLPGANVYDFSSTIQVASAAGVPVFDHKHLGISHADVGNSMHVGVIMCVSFAVLSNVELV